MHITETGSDPTRGGPPPGGLTPGGTSPPGDVIPQGVGPHPRRPRPTSGHHSESPGVPHLPPPWGYCLDHITVNGRFEPQPGFVAPTSSRWGQKIYRHRRRRQELARDTESAGGRPRSRPPIARARFAGSGGFLFSWAKNLTAPTTSPRARARYRIGGPEVAAADLNQGREIQNLGLKVPRGAQGCRLCCCCCCCMQKSSAPFFFSFRRFLFCTLVEVRYWPKENVITSSVGGARLLQDAHADEIGA